MSPEPWLPYPPTRASPIAARRASLAHWWGRSGASVARTTMIEPPSAPARDGPSARGLRGASQGLGTSVVGIASPTATPSIRSWSRSP